MSALGDRLQNLEVSFVQICCGTVGTNVKNSFNGTIVNAVGLRRPRSQAVVFEPGVINLSKERLMDNNY